MEELFDRYLQGTVTQEEYKKVLNFIQNSKNDVFLDGLMLKEWKRSIKVNGNIEPNERILNAVHHSIALKEKTAKTPYYYYRIFLGSAAVFILALIIGSLLLIQSKTPAIITQNVSTPYGGKMNFTLPDGSLVWLNADSEFSFPSKFEDKRVVTLSGEAYFDVVEGKEPFIVKTMLGEIEVLGTEFDVRAYSNESIIATLVEGSVQFRSETGKQAVLKPGQQVIYDSTNIVIKNVDPEIHVSWKDGRLIFRNEPLQKMITRLERWYNVDIELQDERLKDIKYTGTIEMESFSEVLELIKTTTPIEYSFDRETRVLSISTP